MANAIGRIPTKTNGVAPLKLAGPNVLAEAMDSEVIALWNRAGTARVRGVATANINLASGLAVGAAAIDGITLVAGELFLLTGQSTPAQNGIYPVVASGATARPNGLHGYDILSGMMVSVQSGTSFADTIFVCTSNPGGTINVTALAFSLLPATTVLYAGGGTSVEAMLTALAAADALKETLGQIRGINAQSGSYTLALTDAGKFVPITNGSANTLTVPPNSSVAFPINTSDRAALG